MTTIPPPQVELVERLRTLLGDEPTTREQSMFGVRAFMVRDRMVVAAQKDGGLLVRVPLERDDELLGRPGASRPEMGAGRSMGPGWITVAASAIETDAGLSVWLTIALDRKRPATEPA
ncbi:MAG: TfoX/Sxy family protein [Chloroflexi bacterium]|nr:TfoX/Sxy family protein [Chloroflexota bacterium]